MTSFSQLHFPGHMAGNLDTQPQSPNPAQILLAHLAYICLPLLLFMFSLANCACCDATIWLELKISSGPKLFMAKLICNFNFFAAEPGRQSNKLKINQVLTRLPICLRPNCVSVLCQLFYGRFFVCDSWH